MKSKTSSEALHSSFELANSKLVPPLLPPRAEFNLKPFPSSRFFLTLSLGSGEISLAFPGLKKPSLAQEVKLKDIITIIIEYIIAKYLRLILSNNFRCTLDESRGKKVISAV